MDRRCCLLLVIVLATGVGVARADKTPRRIAISVTKSGFDPKSIKIKKGETVTLIFTRKTEHTCVKQVILYLDDDKTLKRDLPLDQAVEITLAFPKAGELGYACAKSHYGGVIIVQ
jgi:plastocyanin domain-containing protein